MGFNSGFEGLTISLQQGEEDKASHWELLKLLAPLNFFHLYTYMLAKSPNDLMKDSN